MSVTNSSLENLLDKFALFARCDTIHDFIKDTRFYKKDENDSKKKNQIKEKILECLNQINNLSFTILTSNISSQQDKATISEMIIPPIQPSSQPSTNQKGKKRPLNTDQGPNIASFSNTDININKEIYFLYYDDDEPKFYLGKIVKIEKNLFIDPDDLYRYFSVTVFFYNDKKTEEIKLEEDKELKEDSQIDRIQMTMWCEKSNIKIKSDRINSFPDIINYSDTNYGYGIELINVINQLLNLKNNSLFKLDEITFTIIEKSSKKKTISCKINDININTTTNIITLNNNITLMPHNFKLPQINGWTRGKEFEISSEAKDSYSKYVFKNYLKLYNKCEYPEAWAFENSEYINIIKESTLLPNMIYFRINKKDQVTGCEKLFNQFLDIKGKDISIDDKNFYPITKCFQNILITIATEWDSSLSSDFLSANVKINNDNFPHDNERTEIINKIIFKDTNNNINWDNFKIYNKDEKYLFEYSTSAIPTNAIPVKTETEYENGFLNDLNIFKTVGLLKHQIINKESLSKVNTLVDLSVNDIINIKRSGDGFQIIRAKTLKNVILLSSDLLFFLQCYINKVPCIHHSNRDGILRIHVCHISKTAPAPTAIISSNTVPSSTFISILNNIKNNTSTLWTYLHFSYFKKQKQKQKGGNGEINSIDDLIKQFLSLSENQNESENQSENQNESELFKELAFQARMNHILINKLNDIIDISDACYQYNLIIKYMSLINIHFSQLKEIIEFNKLNPSKSYMTDYYFMYKVILKLLNKQNLEASIIELINNNTIDDDVAKTIVEIEKQVPFEKQVPYLLNGSKVPIASSVLVTSPLLNLQRINSTWNRKLIKMPTAATRWATKGGSPHIKSGAMLTSGAFNLLDYHRKYYPTYARMYYPADKN